MTASALVLVTGSAGRIGRAVVKELRARRRPTRGFDRVATPGLDDAVVGQITDPIAIRQAMTGVGTVVHLAATPDDVDDVAGDLIPNNVVGVYRVFEAAREAGVHRLILASSGQVVWHQRLKGPLPIGANDPPTPRGWYAATKLFLEGAGRVFAEAHGMSVIVVRLGWCPRPGQEEEMKSLDWAPDVYLSPADAGRFFACAVEAQDIHFAVVYATSKPVRKTYFDMKPAKELLGYEAKDAWPQGIESST